MDKARQGLKQAMDIIFKAINRFEGTEDIDTQLNLARAYSLILKVFGEENLCACEAECEKCLAEPEQAAIDALLKLLGQGGSSERMQALVDSYGFLKMAIETN